jgi:hypothetical protein
LRLPAGILINRLKDDGNANGHLLPPFLAAQRSLIISACRFGGVAKMRFMVRSRMRSVSSGLRSPSGLLEILAMADTPRIHDPFFYYIGLIAAKWTAVETTMEFIILEVQNIPETTGLVLTAALSTRAKMDLLETFVNWKADRVGAKDPEAVAILKDIKDAYTKRNNAVHHLWSPTTDPNIATRQTIRSKGRLKQVAEAVHIDSLDADAIHQLGMRLSAMRKAKRFHTEHDT